MILWGLRNYEINLTRRIIQKLITYLTLRKKYTQFNPTVNMKDYTIWTRMGKKEFLESVIYNRNSYM